MYQHNLGTICNNGLCKCFEERYLFKVDGSLSEVKLEASLSVATASTGIIAACPELPLHPEDQKSISRCWFAAESLDDVKPRSERNDAVQELLELTVI